MQKKQNYLFSWREKRIIKYVTKRQRKIKEQKELSSKAAGVAH